MSNVLMLVGAALFLTILVFCLSRKTGTEEASIQVNIDASVFAPPGDPHLPERFNPTRDVIPLGGFPVQVHFLVARQGRTITDAEINATVNRVTDSRHKPWTLRFVDDDLGYDVVAVSSYKLTKAEFEYAWTSFLRQNASALPADWRQRTHPAMPAQ